MLAGVILVDEDEMDATFDQKPLTQALLRLVEQSLWAHRQWVEFIRGFAENTETFRQLIGSRLGMCFPSGVQPARNIMRESKISSCISLLMVTTTGDS